MLYPFELRARFIITNLATYREQIGAVVKRTDGFYIRYYKDSDRVRAKLTERVVRPQPRCAVDTCSITVFHFLDQH